MIRRRRNSRGKERRREGGRKIKTEMGLERLKEGHRRDAADMWTRLQLIRGGRKEGGGR